MLFKNDIMGFLITHSYLVIYLGAIAVHLFKLYRGSFSGSQQRLKELFPKWKEETYYRIDFIITPILGSSIAYFLFQPTDLQSAILNGITWQIALISILEAKKND